MIILQTVHCEKAVQFSFFFILFFSDWCAVIVLVPVRLGGEEVNGIYIRPLQSLFSMTNCIGIIGGKPKHSLYFVGFQGKHDVQRQIINEITKHSKTKDFKLRFWGMIGMCLCAFDNAIIQSVSLYEIYEVLLSTSVMVEC